MNWRNLEYLTPWNIIDCINGEYKVNDEEVQVNKNQVYIDKILDLHSKGFKPKEIREQTGCHWTFIHNTIKKNT